MLRHEHVDKNLGLLVVAVASWIEGDHRSLSSACSRRTECSKLGFAGGSIATDDERRRLAVKGKELGGKRVADVAGIVPGHSLGQAPNASTIGVFGSVRVYGHDAV